MMLDHNEQRARDALAFEPLPVSRWMLVDYDKGIYIAVHYSEPLSRLLRSLPAAKWESDHKRWRYPYSSSEAIRQALPDIERLAGAAKEAADKETEKREAHKQAINRRQTEQQAERERQQAAARPRSLRDEYTTARDAPLHSLALESIGDDTTRIKALGFRPRAWVAQIMGFDGRGKPVRAFLDGQRDYAGANSIGSRGVTVYYELAEGPIYEVSSPQSWRSTDRYFLRIIEGERIRMTANDVKACLA